MAIMTEQAEQMISRDIWPDRWMYPPPSDSPLWAIWKRLYGIRFNYSPKPYSSLLKTPRTLAGASKSESAVPAVSLPILTSKDRCASGRPLDQTDVVYDFHRMFGEITTDRTLIEGWVNANYYFCAEDVRQTAVNLLATYFCSRFAKGTVNTLARFEEWAFFYPERRAPDPLPLRVDRSQACWKLAAVGIEILDVFKNLESTTSIATEQPTQLSSA